MKSNRIFLQKLYCYASFILFLSSSKQILLISYLLFFFTDVFSQTPFYSEDFDSGDIPINWSNRDISENNVLWEYCDEPDICAPGSFMNADWERVFGNFNSTTVSNGYMFIDSDKHGELEENHIVQLRTSPINCTAYDKVYLRFETHIATFNNNATDNAIVKVQSGVTGEQVSFTVFENLNNENEAEISINPTIITIDISSVAANAENVFICWEWTGNFEYSWAIDDIKLYNTYPNIVDNQVYYEDFDGGLNGWQVNYIMPSEEEMEGWEWYPDGDVGNGAFAQSNTTIESLTPDNGTVVLNYDYLKTQGDPANAPPFPYPDIISELISPKLNLRSIEEPLALEFSQMVRRLNATAGRFFSSFAISTDGGATYGDAVEINENIEPNASPHSSREVFALPDIAGETDVRIKFTYAGDFYFWVLDDIALTTNIPLAVEDSFFRGELLESEVFLSWEGKQRYTSFNIERSSNGKEWNTLQKVIRIDEKSNYSYIDQLPLIGLNYYRLKLIENNDKFTYSKIIQLQIEQESQANVYPNPVKNSFSISNFNGAIQLYNNLQQPVSPLIKVQASTNVDIEHLDSGIYLISFIYPSGKIEQRKIVKQSR